MTEERKKYLANISKEERIIRDQIKEYRLQISNSKFELALNSPIGLPPKFFKQIIRCNKTLIKALKKQLPAPKVVCETKYMVMISCPRCRIGDMLFGDYCPYCGQKLRFYYDRGRN